MSIPAHVRRDVANKYGCKPGELVVVKCHYCEETGSIFWSIRRSEKVGWVSIQGLEMDHVVPESAGGKTSSDNIVLACRHCNRSKRDKLADEWRPK